MAGDSRPVLPRRRGPDLAGLAAFTLDPDGLVHSWPVTAERLFGHRAQAVTGRDICDVLMTGPGQREMTRKALAEVADGPGLDRHPGHGVRGRQRAGRHPL